MRRDEEFQITLPQLVGSKAPLKDGARIFGISRDLSSKLE